MSDGNSPDTNPIQELLDKPATRRAFLKVTAATAAGLALAGAANAVEIRGREENTSTATPIPILTPESQTPSEDFKKQLLDLTLSELTDAEKVEALKQIDKYKQMYLASTEFPAIVDRIENIFRPMIIKAFNEVSKSLDVPINRSWADLLAGVIIAECSAEPNPPDGHDGEIGPTQIKPDVAAEVIKFLNLPKESDIRDPQTNLILGLGQLMKIMLRSFKNPGMILLGYNSGSGKVVDLIEDYALEKLGQDQSKNILTTMNQPRGPAKFESKDSIGANFVNLWQSKRVNESSGKNVPTEKREYPAKVIGATLAYLDL